MDLKNAAAVCLISLFSSTLVVLIARALDSQAASQLEPQLASIVEELRAIRKQGGIGPISPGAVPSPNGQEATAEAPLNDSVDNGVLVYYFHNDTRCATCQAIESQAKKAVQTEFAKDLALGRLGWKVLNYQQPAGKALGEKFEVQMPIVVLAEMKDGKIGRWRRLDDVWGLVDDQAAFKAYVGKEIRAMLAPAPAGDLPLP